MTTYLSKIQEMNKKMEYMRNEMRKETQQLFTLELKELFAQYHSVKSVSWSQYTPYFNDGSECIFGVNSDNLDVESSDFVNNELHPYDEVRSDTCVNLDMYRYHEAIDSGKNEMVDEVIIGTRPVTDDEWSKIVEEYSHWGRMRPERSNCVESIKETKIFKILDAHRFAAQFYAVLTSIDDDILKDIFGDHVKVTINSDGSVETDGYEHE